MRKARARAIGIFFPEYGAMQRLLREFGEVNLAMEEEIKTKSSQIALMQEEIDRASEHITALERQIALMRDEIERASAHIAMQEREISLRDAEIRRLAAVGTNSTSVGITAESSAIARFFFYAKNEGFRPTLSRIRGRIARRFSGRH